MLLSLPLYVFPLCMLAAAVSDIRKFIIPNSVSLILIAGFFLCFAVSGLGMDVLLNHVLSGIVMLAVGIALFAFRVCGAGDSKLLAAAALWLGWPVFGTALIYIALFGRGALTRDDVLVPFRLDAEGGGHEGAGVIGLRVFEHRLADALLDNLAIAHHKHPVR